MPPYVINLLDLLPAVQEGEVTEESTRQWGFRAEIDFALWFAIAERIDAAVINAEASNAAMAELATQIVAQMTEANVELKRIRRKLGAIEDELDDIEDEIDDIDD